MFSSIRVGQISRPQILVVGVLQNGDAGSSTKRSKKSAAPSHRLDAATAKLDADGSIADAISRPEFTAEVGRIVEAYPKGAKPAPRVLIVGLGKPDKLDRNALFAAGAAVGRRLASTKSESARIEIQSAVEKTSLNASSAGRAIAEAIGLLGFDTTAFKGTASNSKDRTKLTLDSSSKAFGSGLAVGLKLAESTNIARMLSQTPPNICTPMWVANEAKKLGRQFTSLNVRVFAGETLEREKLNGLINVGKASANKPVLIRIEYKPARAAKKSDKPVVLIGKTMTYDTGGLSLKVGGTMPGMKRDMDGGAAVLGAMHFIAGTLKPNRRVVAFLTSAENSVSSVAYRPDDIITFRNGVTCEITNTDAEGRLVLADALCYACDKENPACIIDLATLTGGVVTALGSTYAGMWCDDDKLRAKLDAASDASGERIWRLPHHQEYRDMMKSDVADILNSNPNRKAHPIQGAAFLSYFVKNGIPWCHLDIAGVHAADADFGPFVKGTATGWGVRFLADLVDQLS